MQGSKTCVSLNSRLESHKDEEEDEEDTVEEDTVSSVEKKRLARSLMWLAATCSLNPES
jgi:hypothetical protein